MIYSLYFKSYCFLKYFGKQFMFCLCLYFVFCCGCVCVLGDGVSGGQGTSGAIESGGGEDITGQVGADDDLAIGLND